MTLLQKKKKKKPQNVNKSQNSIMKLEENIML